MTSTGESGIATLYQPDTLCPLVAQPNPTEARFPAVPVEAGHYESFYIKACHPAEPLGVWIRYTVHKRPGALPNGSLWVTLFDGAAEGPRAHKETKAGPIAGGGDWIGVGEASMRPGAAVGAIDGAEWDLRFATSEPPLFHLPRAWMYRARLPRTKLLSPAPAARFDGSLRVDGRAVAVDAWPGVIGHNWGAQHAERWIWLHGLTESGDWLDAALGKVKLGPVTTPWVASGALSLDGRRQALGGPGRKLEVRESPERCDFLLSGKGVRVRGTVEAARKDFVGWVYADPDGPEHNTVNCSIADMRLQVERDGGAPRELEVRGAAAYELGMRERDHGIPIQPFPDG
jgi:hypothetical protein